MEIDYIGWILTIVWAVWAFYVITDKDNWDE